MNWSGTSHFSIAAALAAGHGSGTSGSGRQAGRQAVLVVGNQSYSCLQMH